MPALDGRRKDDIVRDSLERRAAAGSTKPRTISRIVQRLEIPRIIAPKTGAFHAPICNGESMRAPPLRRRSGRDNATLNCHSMEPLRLAWKGT